MNDKLMIINSNQVITYLNVDGKMYAAYTKSENPLEESEVFFAECSNVDGANVFLPVVSNDTLSKVLKKYDSYVAIMTDMEEYNVEDEEEE